MDLNHIKHLNLFNLVRKRGQSMIKADRLVLGNIPVWEFGLKFNENITYIDLLNNAKTGLGREELECELNELANYVFNGERTVAFHEFRQFPYIQHGELNTYDACGKINNYMQSDYYFIQFIKIFFNCKEYGKYSFPSAAYIIENTTKVDFNDYPMIKMSVDVLYKWAHKIKVLSNRRSTGKNDISGQEVFEGDIIESHIGKGQVLAHNLVIRYGTYQAYCPVDKCFMDSVGFYASGKNLPDMPIGPLEDYAKVIGNITDNPELIDW